MKLKSINLIEIIAAIIFIVGYFFRSLIPYPALFFAVSGLVLVILYFNLGFFSIKAPGGLVANSVTFGIIFGVGIIALMFSHLRWPSAGLYINAGLISFFIVGFIRLIAVSLFKSPKILAYNNWIAIRYVVILILMLCAFFGYKFR